MSSDEPRALYSNMNTSMQSLSLGSLDVNLLAFCNAYFFLSRMEAILIMIHRNPRLQ